jgi:hypothetical protein
MEHEDRLDALLDSRLHDLAHGEARPLEDDALVAPIAAADHLLGMRSVEPEEAFAHNLEARLLAHAQALATATPPATQIADRPSALPPSPAHYSAAVRRVARRTRVLWPLIAASLALVIGIGSVTMAVAAAARPGSPLYALHRWEQGVQVQLAPTAADRVQLHLANARDALTSLNAAAAHRQGDPAYSDALATLRSEDHAAATILLTLPLGSERDNLMAQLNALHQEERRGLYAALPVIGWPDQLATTQALGSLGVAIPQVKSVTLQQLASGGVHGWKVTITGSGFAPEVALVGSEGAVVGQVIASGPTQIIVDISDSQRHLLNKGAGVRNPDGTAAELVHLTEAGSGKGSGGVGSQAAPSPGGGGTHTGGHEPAPSPSVAAKQVR